jgi:hypothetical protein
MCGLSSLIHALPLILENKKFISGTQPILCQQLRDIGKWFAKPINSKE